MLEPAPPDELELFDALCELPLAQRAERLAALRRSSPDVASRVERLLQASDRSGDFLGLLDRDSDALTRPTRPIPAAIGDVLRAGVTVGPFRLLRELGRGGMATVWLAHDPRLDRAVALKFLAPLGRQRPGVLDADERFLIEARAAAALDHPHVATVHEVGRGPDGRPYIAMAHCEGGSLAARLAQGPLAVDTAVAIAAQVASALQAAHARGIVHRDVKPANVLFDAAGRVRLADFGIARFAGQELTSPGVVLGTVAYLSPEQVEGVAGDERADLWALGVTLYEMLAGRRPFDGETPGALMHAILSVTPPTLQTVRPDVSDDLRALVEALLDRSPSQRPASAAEVVQLLEGTLRANPLTPAVPDAGRAAAVALGASMLAPLVGREGELASALGLLGRTRLLTLTGPGGTGKTRLALELARRASAWFGGPAVMVRLAGIADAERVPEAIAHGFGLRDSVGVGDGSAVARHLGHSAVLLVLDNFEHVLGAAPFVAELLEEAPKLTIVVTSREPLRLRAEQELPVPPLGLPDDDEPTEVGASDAVRLFVQRARACRPDFSLTADNAGDVAQLCRRLDGLPLALELAAARTRFFSPRALLARLNRRLDLLRSDARDGEPRHRALRDVMAWSHDLLTPAEQTLFAELGAFAGSMTLESIAAVATHEAPESDSGDASVSAPNGTSGGMVDRVLDAVASLCDKSLLTRRDAADGEPRLAMLETVREFARERLAESGRGPQVRARHARWYATLADAIGDETGSPERANALQRVQADLDDVLAALEWSTGSEGQAIDALRMVGGLTMFWHWSGLWREGRRWAECAIAAADRAADRRGQRDDALRSPEELDALGRTLQAAHLLSWTLGEPGAALDHAARAIRIWTVLEAAPFDSAARRRAAHWSTYTHCVAAFSHLAFGDSATATRSTDLGVAAARRAGGAWIIGFALGWRAMLHTSVGRVEAAAADLAEAERTLDSISDTWTLSWCYTQAAVASLAAGDVLAAARQAGTAVVMMREAPDWHSVARGLEVMAAAGVAWLDAADRAAPHRTAIACDATMLLSAAAASRQRGKTGGWRTDREEAELTERHLRRALSDHAFAEAWECGQALSGEAMLQLAETASTAANPWPVAALDRTALID